MSASNFENPKANPKSKNGPSEEKEKKIQKLESLLQQSALGHHLLFDREAIREALASDSQKEVPKADLNTETLAKVQKILNDLIEKPTLLAQQCFIRDLDPESYQLLIRTYFNIVENTVRAQSAYKH
jgi:hypothetical protein